MGRKILVGENNPSTHPILSLSLFVVYVAAIVGIVSSLCGSSSRKKSPSRAASESQKIENSNIVISQTKEATTIETSIEPPMGTSIELENSLDTIHQQSDESQLQPLPPPPGPLRGANLHHHRSSSEAMSHRKMLSSTSMRVQNGGGMASRQQSRREKEHEKKREKQLKHEDSVWKKTIILGERCKVPDEGDDAILYDENGNRISAYHRKTPSSLPVSRQSSYIDQDAIPFSHGQEKR